MTGLASLISKIQLLLIALQAVFKSDRLFVRDCNTSNTLQR
jgi:hypothetical protein